MTHAKRAEHEYRHNKAPRIPRIPEPMQNRQPMFTLVAVIGIFLAVAGWLIFS